MDDLINRNAAWEEIKKVPIIQPDRMVFKLQQALWDVPTVDAIPAVHGEWNTHTKAGYYMHGGYVCSICDKEFYYKLGKEKTPFCPYCGAKMDRGKIHGTP